MILIICAAGRGTRIKKAFKDPKTLIEFNQKSIIQNILGIFDLKKIKKIIIVVGYKKEKIIRKIGYKFGNKEIVYIISKKYKTTNNMYSLFLTKKYIDQDIIFITSDLYLEGDIKNSINELKLKNFVLIDKDKKFFKNPDLTKVYVKNRYLQKLGKSEYKGDVNAVALGMYGMTKNLFKKFIKVSEKFIQDKKYKYGYNEVIKELIKKKYKFSEFYPKNYLWRNINKSTDINYVKNELKKKRINI
tara:strand:- start:328 stop:1062 length:735 start_codon:yes stop_codon:yes gene_type:complete